MEAAKAVHHSAAFGGWAAWARGDGFCVGGGLLAVALAAVFAASLAVPLSEATVFVTAVEEALTKWWNAGEATRYCVSAFCASPATSF